MNEHDMETWIFKMKNINENLPIAVTRLKTPQTEKQFFEGHFYDFLLKSRIIFLHFPKAEMFTRKLALGQVLKYYIFRIF